MPRRSDSGLSLLASAGLDTVAVRAPAHEVAQALLRETGRPIAAPSANRSGRVSPTEAAHVAEELGDRVALILDGGRTQVGLEFDGPRPVGWSSRTVAAGRGYVRAAGGTARTDRTRRRRARPNRRGCWLAITRRRCRCALTRSEPGRVTPCWPSAPRRHRALPRCCGSAASADLAEAAANLFAMMRRLDRPPFTGIAVMPIPEQGLGRAINDRLRRAAAAR